VKFTVNSEVYMETKVLLFIENYGLELWIRIYAGKKKKAAEFMERIKKI